MQKNKGRSHQNWDINLGITKWNGRWPRNWASNQSNPCNPVCLRSELVKSMLEQNPRLTPVTIPHLWHSGRCSPTFPCEHHTSAPAFWSAQAPGQGSPRPAEVPIDTGQLIGSLWLSHHAWAFHHLRSLSLDSLVHGWTVDEDRSYPKSWIQSSAGETLSLVSCRGKWSLLHLRSPRVPIPISLKLCS